MADEKKEKKVYKFKPILATAKKLPPVDGQDMLEINVPIEEDSDALVGEATKRDRRDNYANSINKEGELDMDEASVDAMLSKKLLDMDVQKTVKDVGTVTLKTLENLGELENKLKRHEEMLIAIRKQQAEACTGVGCVKDEIENIKSSVTGADEKLEDVIKRLEKIDTKTERHEALCSGKTGCGHDIEVGSSYCPNCGKEIDGWEGMTDWVPYPKRK